MRLCGLYFASADEWYSCALLVVYLLLALCNEGDSRILGLARYHVRQAQCVCNSSYVTLRTGTSHLIIRSWLARIGKYFNGGLKRDCTAFIGFLCRLIDAR